MSEAAIISKRWADTMKASLFDELRDLEEVSDEIRGYAVSALNLQAAVFAMKLAGEDTSQHEEALRSIMLNLKASAAIEVAAAITQVLQRTVSTTLGLVLDLSKAYLAENAT